MDAHPQDQVPTQAAIAESANLYQRAMLDGLARWHGVALTRAAEEAAETAVMVNATRQAMSRQATELARLRQLVITLGGNPDDGIPETQPPPM